MTDNGYDIIGDVHGCANALALLLQQLGYTNETPDSPWPVYRHPTRKAIFLGDIVDRGPRVRESLHIVKGMVDAGYADCIMGNHEYNALGYTTAAPSDCDKTYVREHNSRHNRLIAETLSQFASYPEEWRMFLDWFQTLPIFIDYPNFRVVHACWDKTLIEEFKTHYNFSKGVSREFIVESARKGSFPQRFMDRLTRGTDLTLPEGRKIQGKDGLERRVFRTKFWAKAPETLQDVAFQPDPLPVDIGTMQLNKEQKRALLSYSETEKPVFVGHYWLQGEPAPITNNLCCLDYSAVKFGQLACYRFDGEQILNKEKFHWVDVTEALNDKTLF